MKQNAQQNGYLSHAESCNAQLGGCLWMIDEKRELKAPVSVGGPRRLPGSAVVWHQIELSPL